MCRIILFSLTKSCWDTNSWPRKWNRYKPKVSVSEWFLTVMSKIWEVKHSWLYFSLYFPQQYSYILLPWVTLSFYFRIFTILSILCFLRGIFLFFILLVFIFCQSDTEVTAQKQIKTRQVSEILNPCNQRFCELLTTSHYRNKKNQPHSVSVCRFLALSSEMHQENMMCFNIPDGA